MCSKGWQGTITYARQDHSVNTTSEVVPNYGCCRITTRANDLSERREWTVTNDDGGYSRSQLQTSWSGDYSKNEMEKMHQGGTAYWCKTVSMDQEDESKTKGSDSGTATFTLMINDSNFMLSLIPPMIPPQPVLEQTHTKHFTSSPGPPNGAASPAYCQASEGFEADPPRKEPWNLGFAPISGTLDPEHPEELKGSQMTRNPGNPTETVIITWDLVHCEGADH
jgi:hypothetical protein